MLMGSKAKRERGEREGGGGGGGGGETWEGRERDRVGGEIDYTTTTANPSTSV